MARPETDGRHHCLRASIVTNKLSQEVEQLRQNLECNHCGAIFIGTPAQARHVKYEQTKVYCALSCRHAAARKRLSTPIPDRGPCLQCGQMFQSRSPTKKYCGMACYTSSPQFRAMIKRNRTLNAAQRRKISETLRTGEYVPCLECGETIYKKRSQRTKKYCSKACYRAYMAKRFDRWIANPQQMALPQCYDEFMIEDELPCLIGGCGWVGRHLGGHVQLAHGILADDFKRAAGFNISTGLVGFELHKLLVETNTGKGDRERVIAAAEGSYRRNPRGYYSSEAREHHAKARALMGHGPMVSCQGCGTIFQQSTPFGRAKYCNTECRDQTYKEQRLWKTVKRQRNDRLMA